MGLVKAEITLRNPKHDELRKMGVEALVDTGALHLCIPEHVANQLNLKALYKRDITTADRKEHLCPYVGPIGVQFRIEDASQEPSLLETRFYWVP